MIKQERVYAGAPNIFSNDFSLDGIRLHLYTFLLNLFLCFMFYKKGRGIAAFEGLKCL